MRAPRGGALALAALLALAPPGQLAAYPTRAPAASRKAEFTAPDARLSRLRWPDGSVSVNDRCPVNQHRLSRTIAPLFVNGEPVGFC